MRLTIALFLTVVSPALARPGADFFEARIRPLLPANCYSCHNQTARGGLRLDSLEALIGGGDSGPAVVPGAPTKSLLIEAVARTHKRIKMPPKIPLQPQEVKKPIDRGRSPPSQVAQDATEVETCGRGSRCARALGERRCRVFTAASCGRFGREKKRCLMFC